MSTSRHSTRSAKHLATKALSRAKKVTHAKPHHVAKAAKKRAEARKKTYQRVSARGAGSKQLGSALKGYKV